MNEQSYVYPVYSIRDCVSGTYGQLMIESNVDTAKRNFRYGCRDGLMGFSRDDFALYRIGDFDVTNGEFSPCSVPVYVCRASDFPE